MKNINTQLKQYLTSEVKFIIAIIGLVWGVAIPYFQIKEDIALIKQNHMTHIETIQNNIERLQENDVRLQEQYVELLRAFSK